MIKVYKLILKGGAAERAAAFYGMLPAAAVDRVDKKKNADERIRSLGCLYLLGGALADAKTDLDSLYYTQNGKPCVKDGYISLSHKGDVCVCAVSDKPVGIDVEIITDAMPAAYAFLSEAEKAFAGDSPERFYSVWTRKEAAVKLTGEGIKAIRKTDIFDKKYFFSQIKSEDCIITVCSFGEEALELHC